MYAIRSYYEIDVLVFGQFDPSLPGIVGGIEAHQQRRGGQGARLVQDASQKRNEVLLTVLGAFAMLDFQQPAFFGQIGGNGSIAVKALVGSRDLLFFRSGIVHGEDIDVSYNFV